MIKETDSMKKVIVLGHGGYAEGVKLNIEMIAGPSEGMYFIDFTKTDDLASFQGKVEALLMELGDVEILFACDLLGASPFRVAAELCMKHVGKYITVAGLNTMAFLELSMSVESELTVHELATQAVETTKLAVAKFPE
jgi:PTS system N-acetylgalactosamine-specific IIA component